jgi:hypothetical protein
VSTLTDEARLLSQIEELRSANLRLLRDLDRARISRQELVDAVYRAAHDAASGLTLAPVPAPRVDLRTDHRPEVAVAMLSDWQLGKRTPSYGTEVCEERIGRYAEKVVRLTNIQRSHHPVRELHVWLLGDIVEGELIFPGQAHRIDASLYRQVAVDGPRILGNFLRAMLANFERVKVTAVIGNHGAIGGPFRREMHPESNSDQMLYRIVKDTMPDPRLEWQIAEPKDERGWYAIDHIGAYSCLLFHGDQIRGGFAGFPWYGLAKKVWGWRTGAVAEPFDDVALGHWHTPVRVPLNRITAYANGTVESDNTYAAEQLAASGRPAQWLLYVEPERGRVTAEYLVRLDDES